MGSMSASDAAPLPRLGEVFFDVRGSARSLRLSWYADTGVAVFSIWQAGTCTGTFRLPMADLQRMIETLRQGPGGRRAPGQPATEPGYGPEPGYGWDGQDAAPPGCASGEDSGGYPASAGPLGYRDDYRRDYTGQRTQAHYLPAAPGPGYEAESDYRSDYAGARTQAHYLPAPAAGSGYEPESSGTAAVSWADNGETVPGPGRPGGPPESFPYGPPDVPER